MRTWCCPGCRPESGPLGRGPELGELNAVPPSGAVAILTAPMSLPPHRPITANRAAHHAAAWRHYYARPRSRMWVPPPTAAVISGAGAFALLQPVAYTVETKPPEPGHHLQAAHVDHVAVGTEYLLVLVVILIGAARLVVKVVRVPLDHLRLGC